MWVPLRFTLSIFCHKDNHCAGGMAHSAGLQYRGLTSRGRCKWKHKNTKRALFPAETGVFEKGPLPESSVCVAVMWYIWVILRVTYTQAGHRRHKQAADENTSKNKRRAKPNYEFISWYTSVIMRIFVALSALYTRQTKVFRNICMFSMLTSNMTEKSDTCELVEE